MLNAFGVYECRKETARNGEKREKERKREKIMTSQKQIDG